MAATFWTGAQADAFDTNAGQPGGPPNGSQMQGNPNPLQITVPAVAVEPPLPQNTAAAPLTTQLAAGNIPHNLQPTNTQQAGGDSVLAQLNRGQVMLGDSTYGQSIAPGAAPPPVPTGAASGVTYSGNGNYSGM